MKKHRFSVTAGALTSLAAVVLVLVPAAPAQDALTISPNGNIGMGTNTPLSIYPNNWKGFHLVADSANVGLGMIEGTEARLHLRAMKSSGDTQLKTRMDGNQAELESENAEPKARLKALEAKVDRIAQLVNVPLDPLR